jgi:hypothetical protein
LLRRVVLKRHRPDRSADDDNQRVDAAIGLLGERHQALASFPGAVVANVDARLFANALDLFPGLPGDVLRPIPDHDCGSFLCQAPHSGKADALASPSYDTDLVLETSCSAGKRIENFADSHLLLLAPLSLGAVLICMSASGPNTLNARRDPWRPYVNLLTEYRDIQSWQVPL